MDDTLLNDHKTYPARDGQAYGAAWVLTVPWAHPLWSQYFVALYDLTTKMPEGALHIYKPGVTHELVVFAMDPKTPLDKLPEDGTQIAAPNLLNPPNHAYQFTAASDAEATERIQKIVDQIIAGEVSPDTDFRAQWNALFSDGVSLRKV